MTPILAALSLLASTAPDVDLTPSSEWARRLSSNYDEHAISVVLFAAAKDEDGGEEFFRHACDAAAWTGLATQALKLIVARPRPTGSGRDSFPSGHSSAAFSLATVLTRHYPYLAPVWYGWAGAVAYSRVVLNRHRWDEILVGAGLGIALSRWAMHDGPSFLRPLQRTWSLGSARIRFGPGFSQSGVSLLRAEW